MLPTRLSVESMSIIIRTTRSVQAKRTSWRCVHSCGATTPTKARFMPFGRMSEMIVLPRTECYLDVPYAIPVKVPPSKLARCSKRSESCDTIDVGGGMGC